MKNTLITLSATALLAMGSVAVADEVQVPALLTDTEMETIIGGGAIWNSNSNAGTLFRTFISSYRVEAGNAFAYMPPSPNKSQGPCNAVNHGLSNNGGC